jgi:hypothetical protein
LILVKADGGRAFICQIQIKKPEELDLGRKVRHDGSDYAAFGLCERTRAALDDAVRRLGPIVFSDGFDRHAL